MKIAHIVDSMSSIAGGMQHTVHEFAAHISERGHQVLLLAGRDSGALAPARVPHVLLPRMGTAKYSFLQGLGNELERFKPDFIIQHGIWSLFAIQVTSYCVTNRVPLAIVPHGMLDPYILRTRRLVKKAAMYGYQCRNLQTAAVVRVLNENEARHVRAVVPDARIVVVPNGISGQFAGMVEREANKVVFLGRIDRKKGLLELLKGWQIALESGRMPLDASLVIAGWGSDRDYERAFLSKVHNTSQVTYIGPVFDQAKSDLLASAGGFVLPSFGEGLPTAVLEAWAAGSVVLMTEECNFPSSVFNGLAIRITTDPKSIADGLVEYFSMPTAERERRRADGLEMLKKYQWPNLVDKFLANLENSL